MEITDQPFEPSYADAVRPLLGPVLDGLPEKDREGLAQTYLSTLAFTPPIPGDPTTRSLLTPLMGQGDEQPDSYYDAFNGYQISNGILSRLVWNTDRYMNRLGWYRSITNGADQPMRKIVGPGQGIIDYTTDDFFTDLAKRDTHTPEEQGLLDRWVIGDFDHVTDPTHLVALMGFYQTEEKLEQEAAKLGTGESIAFGFGTALLEAPTILGSFNAARLGPVLWGGQRATMMGRVARNVQQGIAFSTVNEGGLMILGERDLEEAASNFAAGAAFDAVAAGVWEAVFKGIARGRSIGPQDFAERAGQAEAIDNLIRSEQPPRTVQDALALKAAQWKARQESVEFTRVADTETFEFVPAYRERGGRITRVTANIDMHRIMTQGATRDQGFLVIRRSTGQVERFLPLEEYEHTVKANFEARQRTLEQIETEKAAFEKAQQPPITTGLLDPIHPGLTLDDFMQIQTSSGAVAQKVVGSQTGWFSKFGMESSKNPVVGLLLTRLFDRVRTVNGWANGRLAGFASFETRRKMQLAKQTRIRRSLEHEVRRIIRTTAPLHERAVLNGYFSNELVSQNILAKRQTVMELLELRRLARLLKMEDVLEPQVGPGGRRTVVAEADGLEPDTKGLEAISARRDALLRRAAELGLPTDMAAYRLQVDQVYDLEFLAPANQDRLGRQIDATRRKVLANYARVRLNPEDITFDGLLQVMRAIKNQPKGSPEVVFKDFLPDGKFRRLELDDLLPENQNSGQTLKRLAQAWNEDLGGYVNSTHVGAILAHLPNSRLNAMVSLDSFMEFVDTVEAHTVWRQIVRELAVADSRFRGRSDVAKVLAKLNDSEYDPFDPKDWEYGTPPYGSIRKEIQDMMQVVADHAKKMATEIPNDPGGEQRVEHLMGYMRRQHGFDQTSIWDKERKLSDITGNVTRATLLTKAGISQIPDSVTLLTIASMNGVQGSVRKTLQGMLMKWHDMAGTPALRNALFRGLALTGETNLSYATQRFSSADYELAVSRISDNQDFLGRVRGGSEFMSETVSLLSGTSLMNATNKGGALVSVLHELTDPEVGIILRLKTALDKFAAAKGDDIVPFLKAEGINPELGELTLRTLNKQDIDLLAAKITAGEFDEIGIKKRFGFLGSEHETTVRLVGEPQSPQEAVAIEKLAHAVNYVQDKRIAIPGMIESGFNIRSFWHELAATFIRQPMSVATKLLVGSSYRPSLHRFAILMTLLGGSVIVGFAKALLSGREEDWVEQVQEHPARFVAERLAWAGAFGWIGEKFTGLALDATSPESFRRINAGEQAIVFPGQSVVRTYGQAFGGAMNALWNGDELNQSHVNAIWRAMIVGETTILKGIQRVFNAIRDEDEQIDAKNYLKDALDLAVGVKEGK